MGNIDSILGQRIKPILPAIRICLGLLPHTRLIILSALIPVILLCANTVSNTFAQAPDFGPGPSPIQTPCPYGQFPETDSFGQIILDPVTHQPICIGS
jgi:hypothetical protein